MSCRSLCLAGLLALSALIAACDQRQDYSPDYASSPDAESAAHHQSPRPAEPTMTISAQEWVALYGENEVMANQKIGGKIVRVIGRVLEFETGGFMLGNDIRLKIGNDGLFQVADNPMLSQLLTNGSLLGMGLASAAKNETYHMYLVFNESQETKLAKLSKRDIIAAICVADKGVARGTGCVLDTDYQFPSDEKATTNAPIEALEESMPISSTQPVDSTKTDPLKEDEIDAGTDWDDDDIPLWKTEKSAPIFKTGDTAFVPPASELNIRAAPNVSSPLVAQLRRNAQLKILGDSAVRNEDEGRETYWLTVELYDGEFCLPPDLGKQAACLNWQRVAPNSRPPALIKGWINRNKIVQVQP